ncbi:glycosyl transferase family 1 [Mesorhizobium sp. CAU 1741]|uniref:glycosyl transferase family 1 n=1 Tax=Mesorhizobium sp. CAU 1741 TaxID=3140366 RepID=UPI00325BF267
MRIAYLAHNLDDPAIARRVRMMQIGGADVDLAGFRRGDGDVVPIHGVVPIVLGRTKDARLLQRVASVAAARLPDAFLTGADLILARNLEMLAIAMRHRRRSGLAIPVVYESLDIHRLLTGNGVASLLLRWIEGQLAQAASLLITSSRAFVREYFVARSRVGLPVLLVENKMLALDEPDPVAVPVVSAVAPPWRIGWFGAIRCRRSLATLGALTEEMDGKVEVVIRGRPAYSEFADFEAEVGRYRHVSFLGPYGSADLAQIYGEVHFAWAVDFFEEGFNSAWLLPNRIYEGGRHGVVPIAEAAVETGRFLADAGIGVLLGKDIRRDLHSFFERLSAVNYAVERAKVTAISPSRWVYDASDCRRLLETLETVAGGKPVESAVL